MWRHPLDRSLEFNALRSRQDVVRILERGLFNALSSADSLGVHGVSGGA